MTRLRRGIFIAKEGKEVGPTNNRYESDNLHLQASLLKVPEHMAITTISGGTAFVTTAVVSTQMETLLTIPHGLSYTPELLIYFYAVSYNGSTTDAKASKYSIGNFVYLGGVVTDSIYATVDATNIKVIHRMDDFIGMGVGAYTSDADKWSIRIKYYILSNDSHVPSYSLGGY